MTIETFENVMYSGCGEENRYAPNNNSATSSYTMILMETVILMGNCLEMFKWAPNIVVSCIGKPIRLMVYKRVIYYWNSHLDAIKQAFTIFSLLNKISEYII